MGKGPAEHAPLAIWYCEQPIDVGLASTFDVQLAHAHRSTTAGAPASAALAPAPVVLIPARGKPAIVSARPR
jgi:hypothetical protein